MTKIIINVGRQIGSGGHIIAEKLAEDFGCKCYDRELLNLAAKESGFSEKFFEQNDEQKGFFKSLFHTHLPFLSDSNFYHNDFSRKVCISSRATPSERLPMRATACLWAEPPTMYCVITRT